MASDAVLEHTKFGTCAPEFVSAKNIARFGEFGVCYYHRIIQLSVLDRNISEFGYYILTELFHGFRLLQFQSAKNNRELTWSWWPECDRRRSHRDDSSIPFLKLNIYSNTSRENLFLYTTSASIDFK